MTATICPKCGHLEHKSRMHQNICTQYVPEHEAECGCSYLAPQAKPTKPGVWAAHLADKGECPNCANPPHEGPCKRKPNPVEAGQSNWVTCEKHPSAFFPRSTGCFMCKGETKDAALEELLAAAEEAVCKLDSHMYDGDGPAVYRLRAAIAKCREVQK